MVDEFVYQFQSFQQYRGKLSQKSAEELAQLRECSQVTQKSRLIWCMMRLGAGVH